MKMYDRISEDAKTKFLLLKQLDSFLSINYSMLFDSYVVSFLRRISTMDEMKWLTSGAEHGDTIEEAILNTFERFQNADIVMETSNGKDLYRFQNGAFEFIETLEDIWYKKPVPLNIFQKAWAACKNVLPSR